MDSTSLPHILVPNPQLCVQHKLYKNQAVMLSLQSIRQCETVMSQVINRRVESFKHRQMQLTKKIDCLLNYLDTVEDGSNLSKVTNPYFVILRKSVYKDVIVLLRRLLGLSIASL